MIRSWPGRTLALTDRWLASASSLRATRSLRAIEDSVSPRFTVYQFNETKSDGAADASRFVNSSAVPVGTFTSYWGYLIGVVQRRSSGLSDWISSIEVPVHSATRRRSIARGTLTLS